MADKYEHAQHNPYLDPELLDRSQGNEEYLSRLVAEHIARRRFESLPPEVSDEEYRAAQENARRMGDMLIDYERERGYIQEPPAQP